jgi:hypothetical protein
MNYMDHLSWCPAHALAAADPVRANAKTILFEAGARIDDERYNPFDCKNLRFDLCAEREK